MRQLSKEDVNFALTNYPSLSIRKIAKHLNTTHYQILMLLIYHRKYKCHYNKEWTEQELDFLKENANKFSRRKLSVALNRKEDDVRFKLVEMKLVSYNKKKTFQNSKTKTTAKLNWAEKEIDFLKRNYNFLSNKELAQQLNCCEHAVINQLNKLNLKRASSIRYQKSSCDGFSDEEIAILKEFFGKVDLLDVMEKMPLKTTTQLQKCANYLKLGTKQQIKNYIKTCIPYKE